MKKVFGLLSCLVIALNSWAQPTSNDIPNYETKKVTLTSGVEGSILQFASLTSGTVGYKTIPRYTYFF